MRIKRNIKRFVNKLKDTLMPQSKRKMIEEIAKAIHIDPRSFYHKTPAGGRFSYHVIGEEKIRHITINTPEEQASFLVKHNKAHFKTTGRDGEAKAWVRESTINGAALLTREVKWQDVIFTQDDAVIYAATHYYEETAELYSIREVPTHHTMAKVITIRSKVKVA